MQDGKQGISLITLIITIVIAIAIAAITIGASGNTVEKATYAKFTSEFSDFQTAADHDYLARIDQASANVTALKDDEIYYMMAKGYTVNDVYMPDAPSEKILGIDQLEILPASLKGTKYFRITSDTNIKNWSKNTKYVADIENHYITNKGEVFVLPGFPIEEEGELRNYVTSKKYYVGNPIEVLPSVETEKINLTKTPDSFIDGEVAITLSHTDIPSGFVMQYKVGREDWQTGSSVLVASNNTIFARLYEPSTYREAGLSYIVVDNIDKKDPLPPTYINVRPSGTSIYIMAKGGSDKDSGIVGYKYSMDNINWSSTVPVDEEYIFTGLNANTEYTIYSKAIDGVGRESTVFKYEKVVI